MILHTLTSLEVDVKNLHELRGDFYSTVCCFGCLFYCLLQTLHHPRKIKVSIYYFCLCTEFTIEFFSTFVLINTGCFSQNFQQFFLLDTSHTLCKGKAIPLQALTGPEGSRRLRLPDFKTVGTWRWQGCQPYTPATFTPRKYSWYSFLLEVESTPGP
jgi:hypothetical protein